MTVQTPDTLPDLLRSIGTQVMAFADKIEDDPNGATLTTIEGAEGIEDLEPEGEEVPNGLKTAPEYHRRQHHVLGEIIRAGGWVADADFRRICREAGYSGKGTGGFHNTEDPLLARERGGFRATRKGRARYGWICAQGYHGLT